MALLLEFGAELGGAPILPDNGIVDRLARFPVPDYHRLALVRDADGGNIGGGGACLLDGGLDRPQHAVPDFLRVVLDPAILREVLGELLLSHAHDLARLVEQDRPARGRALIDRQNELGHENLPTGLAALY